MTVLDRANHVFKDVGIAIVLKSGQEGKLSADSLRVFMKDKVAKFKLPKKVSQSSHKKRTCYANTVCQVFFTDIMPKTATGKIQRRQVAATMLEKEGKAKL